MTDVFQNADSHFQGGGVNDNAAVPGILKQDVAAVAQQIILHAAFPAQGDSTAKLLFGLRLGEYLRRAADLKGAVGGQRLIFPIRDALSPQLLFQLFHKLVVPLSGCYSMVPSKPSRMSSSFAAL